MKKRFYLLIIIAIAVFGLFLTQDRIFASANSVLIKDSNLVSAIYKANYEKSIKAYENIMLAFQRPSARALGTDIADWDASNDNFAGVYLDENGRLNVCTVNFNYTNINYSIIHKEYNFSYIYLRSIQKDIESIMKEKNVLSVGINVKENFVNINLRKDNQEEILDYINSKGYSKDAINISSNLEYKKTSSTVYGGNYITSQKSFGTFGGTVTANAIHNKTGMYGILTAAHVVQDKITRH